MRSAPKRLDHAMSDQPPPHCVLLVDPLPGTRVVAQNVLEDAGHEVLPVSDWEAAEVLLLRAEVTAVVMALVDVGFDGLDAARRLRERLPPQADLPLVGTTSGLRHGEEDEALDAGFDVLLVRPFNDVELLAALDTAVRDRKPPPKLDPDRRVALRATMGPVALAAADDGAMEVAARLLVPIFANGATPAEYEAAGNAVATAMAEVGAIAAEAAARRLAESPTDGPRLIYPLMSAAVAARVALRTDRMTAARADPIWAASEISPGEAT
jgi:CheY-like chemotaxis protein